MNDRELLERAARAAGVPGVYAEVHGPELGQDAAGIGPADARYGVKLWNSLTDDGDALRLAVRMRQRVTISWDNPGLVEVERIVGVDGGWWSCETTEEHHTDAGHAARRAITRAAAAALGD